MNPPVDTYNSIVLVTPGGQYHGLDAVRRFLSRLDGGGCPYYGEQFGCAYRGDLSEECPMIRCPERWCPEMKKVMGRMG